MSNDFLYLFFSLMHDVILCLTVLYIDGSYGASFHCSSHLPISFATLPLCLLLINCQSSLNVREAAGKYITLTLLCDVQIHWKAWLYKEEAQKKERI